MKKTLFILTLLSVNAFAGELEELESKLCGMQADIAVLAVQAGKNGVPWRKLEASFEANKLKRVKNIRTAYFNYSNFEPEAIRNLTYANCQIDFIKEKN